MESLGKRNQRLHDSDDDRDGSNQHDESKSSKNDDSNEPRNFKRQRHDSSDENSEENSQDRNPIVEDEGDLYENEMMKLYQEAQNQLMQEDELFKNMSNAEIQRILNENEFEEVKLEKNSIKKMIAKLRQALNENLEKRIQNQNEPEGFLESEADLHASLKEVQVISAFPQYISEFIENEGIQLLIEILDHQNPDINTESMTLLVELTDEEILTSNPDFNKIVEILIQNEVWNFLVRVLQKLDDNESEERPQIFKCLSLIENILDQMPSEAANKLMHIDPLIDWFIVFLTEGDRKSENYLQIAELLFSIVSFSHNEYKSKFNITLQGLERLLRVVNRYRKDFKIESEEELEAIANIFDTISALLLVQENLDTFRKIEAFELLTSLSKKQKLLRRHIIKVFDFALGIAPALDNKKNCRYFVDHQGLSIIFAFFMLKQEIKEKKKKKNQNQDTIFVRVTADEIQQDETRILNIIISLILNTIPDEQESGKVIHERVLFKFIENDYEKLQRLFELHLKYFSLIEEFDLSQFQQKEEIDYLVEDYQFNILEQVDFIIGFLISSKSAIQLSDADPIDHKINEFIKLNGIKKESLKEVLRLSLARQSDLDEKHLIYQHTENLINQLQ
ncbi:beta-catenin-like protein 1-like [Stylonychia lemnae]|uniref:Beta-catenin-like protein 1-like n=1 Tax=Stylonychia lemnae TaxID=5949 RepID=A0A077ZUV6_STYLE|nr:beta-catenin-like protein 1-like [Stylonychia lemnae]|eukprot:CDW73679.1 beta-catenin-like protein 1-like [Stylonychia lemnae]